MQSREREEGKQRDAVPLRNVAGECIVLSLERGTTQERNGGHGAARLGFLRRVNRAQTGHSPADLYPRPAVLTGQVEVSHRQPLTQRAPRARLSANLATTNREGPMPRMTRQHLMVALIAAAAVSACSDVPSAVEQPRAPSFDAVSGSDGEHALE